MSEFTNGLRAAADWYDANPDVETQCMTQFDVFVYGEDPLAMLRSYASKLGVEWDCPSILREEKPEAVA